MLKFKYAPFSTGLVGVDGGLVCRALLVTLFGSIIMQTGHGLRQPAPFRFYAEHKPSVGGKQLILQPAPCPRRSRNKFSGPAGAEMTDSLNSCCI